MDLFDEDEDAEPEEQAQLGDAAGEEDAEFRVNKSYANRFEQRKKKQELARLRDLHGDLDEDEDASSEDEDGKLLTKELDLKIIRAIHTIRQRRPEVYSQEGLFPDQDDTEGEETEGEGEGSSGEEAGEEEASGATGKGLTIRDHLRSAGAAALDSDGGGSSDGDGGSDTEGGDGAIGGAARARQRRQLAYDPEQQELRRALSVKPAEKKESGGDGGSESGDDGDDLLVRREVPPEERDAEADEYAGWLKEQLAKEGPVDEAVTLRRYMLDDNLDSSEAFLRDYMLNAMWRRPAGLPQPTSRDPGLGRQDAGSDAEGDTGGEGEGEGEFSEREDEFERAHNFRYEELGAARVMSHPRQVDGSVRRQAEQGRKREAAALVRARKEELKARKAAELKRLKNLKKAEIRERLAAIEKVSGVSSLEGLDLSGDFDPDTWDKQMSSIFSAYYYSQPDEALRAEMEADETEEWGGETEQAAGGGGEGEEAWGEAGGWSAASEAGGAAAGAKRARGGRRAKGSLEAAAAAASGGDASSELIRTTKQALDEYYGLDYEDVIGEGESALATRFKYRQVEPAGYGVSDADLLSLDDRTLSKRVPMRAVKRPYAHHDAPKLKARAKRLAWADEAQRRDAERIAAKKKKTAHANAAAAAEGRRGRGAAARDEPRSEPGDGGAPDGEVEAVAAAGAAPAKRRPGTGDGRDAPRGAKPKRKRVEAPEPAAESKKGVATSRLAAFAQVNRRSKKEARVEHKERKRKDAAAGAPTSKWL